MHCIIHTRRWEKASSSSSSSSSTIYCIICEFMCFVWIFCTWEWSVNDAHLYDWAGRYVLSDAIYVQHTPFIIRKGFSVRLGWTMTSGWSPMHQIREHKIGPRNHLYSVWPSELTSAMSFPWACPLHFSSALHVWFIIWHLALWAIASFWKLYRGVLCLNIQTKSSSSINQRVNNRIRVVSNLNQEWIRWTNLKYEILVVSS